MRSIYDNAYVAALAGPFFATTGSVAAMNGASVDTKGYNTAALRVFITATGSTALTPSTVSTLTAVLQESSDNSTFTTALDNTGVAIGFPATAVLTATTTAVIGSARIEGLGLQRKRYLRVVLTPFLSGGAIALAPNSFTAVAVIELARAYNNPVTAVVSNT